MSPTHRGFRALCAAALLAWPAAARGQGAAGVELLLLPVGARPTALGGAYAAAPGLDGIWYNPAALAGTPRAAAHVSLLTSRDLFNQTYGAASLGFGRNRLALSLLVQRFDAIPAMDDQGQPAGEVSPQTVVAGLTFARQAGAVAFGATARGVRSDLLRGAHLPGASASASAVVFDAGLHARLWQGALPATLGLAVSDVGNSLTYADERDSAPAHLRAGVALGPLHVGQTAELRLLADAIAPKSGAATELAAGAELRLARVLDLRAGATRATDNTRGTPAWLGLGLHLARLDADLARRLTTNPALGEEWSASLGFGF